MLAINERVKVPHLPRADHEVGLPYTGSLPASTTLLPYSPGEMHAAFLRLSALLSPFCSYLFFFIVLM